MTTERYSKDDVVAAAGRLFAERGYHGTSMRDLGRALGLHGSSLYSHVASKEDLLVAVVEHGAWLFQASADAASTVEDPSDRLYSLIRGHIDVVLDHRDEARTFLDEARAIGGAGRRRVIEHRDRYEGAFRRALEDGVSAGLYRADTDPVVTAIFALSILNALDRWYDPADRLDRDGLATAIQHQLVSGIER